MNFGGVVRLNRTGLVFLICVVFIIILYSTFRGGSRTIPILVVVDDNPLLHSALVRSKGFYSGKVSLKALLSAAIDSAVKGGEEVVAVRKIGGELEETVKGKTKEGVKDFATQGDYRSHKIMYYGMRKAFPEVKVISEEHTETPSDLSEVVAASIVPSKEVEEGMLVDETVDADDVAVWIDPLDATKEYTENLIQYVTTMVGISLRGKPILGVVHRPFTGETYWAVVGRGSSPNLHKSDSGHKEENKMRIIVSRSHAGGVTNFTKSVLPGEKVEIIEAAGAGYKVLEVILSRAEAYVHVTAIKKWDLCAGYALLSALEGSMTTLNGEAIDFEGHSDPLNTKGILAWMKDSPSIEKLKSIRIQ